MEKIYSAPVNVMKRRTTMSEHKKSHPLRDERGKFVFKADTVEMVAMPLSASGEKVEIATGQTIWVCICGMEDCPEL